MKNKHTGFSLIEILLVVVIIGIMVTVGVPSFLEVMAKAHDTERLTGLQRLSRAVITTSVNSSIPQDFTALQASLNKVEAIMPTSDTVYCYVYGVNGNDFFAVVPAESDDSDFIVEGSRKGVQEFQDELNLHTTLQNCDMLSTPTVVNGYEVFYLP